MQTVFFASKGVNIKTALFLLVGFISVGCVTMARMTNTNPASMTREYAAGPEQVLNGVAEMAVSEGWLIERQTDSIIIVRKTNAIVGKVVY